MTMPSEAERYIRFQLEHLTARNEHHTFEEIAFRVAERRLSSNLLLATGPVSAGGDQGRDAESYYTSLPQELPGAGGFVGRATTEPLVVAASVQREGLEAKIRSDLQSICGRGEPVARVAFFAVHEVPVSVRHRLQASVRETHSVALEIFDGQALAQMLAQGDLVWVAQRYLDLPSHMVPEMPGEPQPDWYTNTLAALRSRTGKRLTPGALSEVREGIRRATFDAEALVDLPEWLRYMREFTDDAVAPEVSTQARYECAVATLRGLNTLDGVEDDIRAVIDYALQADAPSALDDASILLMYWGGAWARHIGTAVAGELRDRNLRLRAHAHDLLAATDQATHPVRTARLLAVAAHLCLHPRWTEVERPPPGTLLSPRETSLARQRAHEANEDLVLGASQPLDVAGAMEYLTRLVDILPQALAFPIGTVTEIFQMLAPSLVDDARYPAVRDGLDAAVAAAEGDSALAERCRSRAIAFQRAGRPLDALREIHNAKINWWHGDTVRGTLLAMRMIGKIYAELRLAYAAKQYALAAGFIALSSGDSRLQDLVPKALAEATNYTYVAGNWADSLALAGTSALAQSILAHQLSSQGVPTTVAMIDFPTLTVLLAAERFRPQLLPTLRKALGENDYARDIEEIADQIRARFAFTEEEFIAQCDEQLTGRPFSDLGSRRTLTFSALGLTWFVTCPNNMQSVLAAERFTAAAQILLVDLAPSDPLFLSQDVHVEVLVGTPLGNSGNVKFKANNEGVTATVILSPFEPSTDPDKLNLELASTLVYLLANLSARPQDQFMEGVEEAFAGGANHKLHVARPYDELAKLLDADHYATVAAAGAQPFDSPPYRPTPAEALAPLATPGPNYDHAAALANIRATYVDVPKLLNQTLPRALADPTTLAGLQQLRDEGWLDWHILLAIFNVVQNIRVRSAGLLDGPDPDLAHANQLAFQPEKPESQPIALTTITPDELRAAMKGAILAVGQRRWRIFPPTDTPNIEAFSDLLNARYGFAVDDVPHRDLLSDALAGDGSVIKLVEARDDADGAAEHRN